MYQVPASAWNQVAKVGPLQTAFAKRLFRLNPAELSTALEQESDKLKKDGVTDPSVRSSYLQLAPLLWERAAIANAVEQSPGLAPALPNVEDVGEAVTLASQDRQLNARQQQQLSELLQREPT